jgi:hypothetical protein
MTKPTKEEIAALERWRSALIDSERGLELARPSSVRYEVLDLAPAIPGSSDVVGEGLMGTIRALRRQIDRLMQSIEGAGQ